LQPTCAAIRAGKDICLANKETLIAGGPYVLPLAREHGVNILPADSEHSVCYHPSHGRLVAPRLPLALPADTQHLSVLVPLCIPSAWPHTEHKTCNHWLLGCGCAATVNSHVFSSCFIWSGSSGNTKEFAHYLDGPGNIISVLRPVGGERKGEGERDRKRERERERGGGGKREKYLPSARLKYVLVGWAGYLPVPPGSARGRLATDHLDRVGRCLPGLACGETQGSHSRPRHHPPQLEVCAHGLSYCAPLCVA
jgi:hypothetical protein